MQVVKYCFLFIVSIVLPASTSVYGQSIVQMIESLNQSKDTVRINLLNKIAFEMRFSDRETSNKYASEAYSLSAKTNYIPGKAFSEMIQGYNKYYIGLYGESLVHFKASLQHYQTLSDSVMLGKAYSNIGLAYSDQQDKTVSFKFYNKALEIYQSCDNKRGIGNIYLNTAYLHSDLGNLDSARKLLHLSAHFVDTANEANFGCYIEYQLAEISLKEGKLEEAKKHLRRSEQYGLIAQNPNTQSKVYNAFAKINTIENNLQAAEINIRKSFEYAQKHSNLPRMRDAYNTWALIDYELGNYKKAFLCYKNYIELRDSISNRASVTKLESERTYFERQQEKALIDLLEREKEMAESNLQLRTYLFYVAIGALLLLLMVLTFLVLQFFKLKKLNRSLGQKNNEIEIKNLKLEQLDAERNYLIGTIAHDLKAPFNKLKGFTQIISNSGPLNNEQNQFIKMMHQQAEEGGRLVQNLLDAKMLEDPDIQPDFSLVNLNHWLSEVINTQLAQANSKGIKIVLETNKKDVLVETDTNFLIRIVENLISNAMKFSPIDSEIHLNIYSDNDEFSICIKDQGPGISEGEQKKMFKKYQRLNNLATAGESSSGLGLSIVKTLVEKLNGEIEIESSKNGTTFCITFPLTEAVGNIMA